MLCIATTRLSLNRPQMACSPCSLSATLFAALLYLAIPANGLAANSLGVGDATVLEGNAGNVRLNFSVSRSGDLTKSVSFDVQTQVGGENPATQNVDFAPISSKSRRRIPATETSAEIFVEVKGDVLKELNETLLLNVSNAIEVSSPEVLGQRVFQTGKSPRLISAKDFNGDGFADIAIANDANPGVVSLLLGDGKGLFSAPRNLGSGGANPSAMATGDFNGDGEEDIAVTNVASRNFSILFNLGDGTFAAPVSYDSAGNAPTSIAVADIDGADGVDVVIGNFDGKSIAVFRNAGDGTFLPAVTYGTGDNAPNAIATGDFDGDGNLDLIFATNLSGSVSVLRNMGNGTFSAATTFSTAGNNPVDLAVGDFNGDDKPDVAVVNIFSSNISILINSQTPLSMLLGRITFANAVVYPTGRIPKSIVLTDLNGDSFIDAAVTNGNDSSISVLLNLGTGALQAESRYRSGGINPVDIGGADFNVDGLMDLIVVNYDSNTISTSIGNGDGTFPKAATVSDLSSEVLPVIVDLNGDDRLDIAFTSARGVEVSLNTGAGIFSASNAYVSGLPVSGDLASGDLNNDGRPDLVTIGSTSSDVAVLINKGDGTFLSGVTYGGGGAAPAAASIGDFNGDGAKDLFIANFFSRNASVLLNSGSGSFGAPIIYGVLPAPWSVETGDFNGDGKLDAAVGDSTTHDIYLLSGQGNGTFVQAGIYSSGLSVVSSTASGDFNSDGWIDVAVSDNGKNAAILLNTGDGRFTAPTLYSVGGNATGPTQLAASDLNRDGAIDLIASNPGAGNFALLENAGDGSFKASVLYVGGGKAAFAVAGDLNGDAKPDLAIAGGRVDGLSTLLSKPDTPAAIFKSIGTGIIVNDDSDRVGPGSGGSGGFGGGGGGSGSILSLLVLAMAALVKRNIYGRMHGTRARHFSTTLSVAQSRRIPTPFGNTHS